MMACAVVVEYAPVDEASKKVSDLGHHLPLLHLGTAPHDQISHKARRPSTCPMQHGHEGLPRHRDCCPNQSAWLTLVHYASRTHCATRGSTCKMPPALVNTQLELRKYTKPRNQLSVWPAKRSDKPMLSMHTQRQSPRGLRTGRTPRPPRAGPRSRRAACAGMQGCSLRPEALA